MLILILILIPELKESIQNSVFSIQYSVFSIQGKVFYIQLCGFRNRAYRVRYTAVRLKARQ